MNALWVGGDRDDPYWMEDMDWIVVLHPGYWTMGFIAVSAKAEILTGHRNWEWA